MRPTTDKEMGNTIQQHRAAIGLYGAIKSSKHEWLQKDEEEQTAEWNPPDHSKQIWKGPWKCHSLALCFMFIIMTTQIINENPVEQQTVTGNLGWAMRSGLAQQSIPSQMMLTTTMLPPSCLKSLLAIGGVEKNPGPVSVEDQITALTELIVSFDKEETKKVLTIYDPAKTKRQQIAAINTLRIGILRAASIDLKVQSVGLTKDKLAPILHLRIQSLLPDNCMYCNENYTIKPDEDPTASCYSCEQGAHTECLTKKLEDLGANANIFSIPGIFWLCDHCDSQHEDPATHNTNDDVVSIKETTNTEPENNQSQAEIPSAQPVNYKQTRSLGNQTKPTRRQTDERQRRSTRKTAASDVTFQVTQDDDIISEEDYDGISNHSDDEYSDSDSDYDIPVCIHYKNGKCRHGMTGQGCDYKHPKQCKKLINHGIKSHLGCNITNKGNKCKLFHPKMCYNSLYKNACYNSQCKFRHVRGTWKKEPGDVQILTRTDTGFGNSNQMARPPHVPRVENQQRPSDFLEMLRLLQVDMQQMNNQMQNLMHLQNRQSALPNTIPSPLQPQQQQPNSWVNQAYHAQINPTPATAFAWKQPQPC